MSATTARAPLAELIELKGAAERILIETRYAWSIQNARMCAADTLAEFMPFINVSAIKADEPPTGTKPCN